MAGPAAGTERSFLAAWATTLLERQGCTVLQLLISTRPLGPVDLVAAGAGPQDEEDATPRWHAWAQLLGGPWRSGYCLIWLAEGNAIAFTALDGPLGGELFAPRAYGVS